MDDPEAHLPADDPAAVVAALTALGRKLIEAPPSDPPNEPFGSGVNSTVPAVFTYLGQFIDHDLTANTDRANVIGNVSDADLHPEDPAVVVAELRNLRLPQLNLDSVYGDGPTFAGEPKTQACEQYNGIELKVGTVQLVPNPGTPEIRGDRIPLEADLARDLPRDADGRAVIGDGRNDENLIIAQLHTAFLRFHNATVRWVRRYEANAYTSERDVFERAQQLVRWHYQWIVVNDFLAKVALPGVVDQVVTEGNTLYAKRNGEAYMPLEFSVAAYRFGHSMVRGVYDFNRNFGRPGRVIPVAPFGLIFAFTGNGRFGARGDQPKNTDVLPFNWVIEWERFVEEHPRFPDHFARKIDTNLAPPLFSLANEVRGLPTGTPPEVLIKEILERLAVRNLLRGYQLNIPTGQAIASVLQLSPLTAEELQENNSPEVNQVLADGGFLERTPLWYYILKEAEVRAGGNSLGRWEVGSWSKPSSARSGTTRPLTCLSGTRAGRRTRGSGCRTVSRSGRSRTCFDSPGCCRPGRDRRRSPIHEQRPVPGHLLWYRPFLCPPVGPVGRCGQGARRSMPLRIFSRLWASIRACRWSWFAK